MLGRGRATAAALLLLTAGCSTTVTGHGAHALTCAPVFFGVPGSGQGVLNPAPGGRPAGITADDARRYGTSVARVKNVLLATAGTHAVSARAVDYPAISTEKYLGVTGLSRALEVSEKKGVAVLRADLRRAYRNGCRNRPVLLAGYSQGAEVVIRTVRGLAPAQRAARDARAARQSELPPRAAGGLPGGLPGLGAAADVRGRAGVPAAGRRPGANDRRVRAG